MYYTWVTDPLTASFLNLRRRLGRTPIHPYIALRTLDTITALPRTSLHMTTHMMSLLRTLPTHFPPHRLLLSDFNSLPDAIPGVTAPVVQARMRESAVASSTIFVRPGFFDIF
jgi:hypothetical protein